MKKDNISEFTNLFFMNETNIIDKSLAFDYLLYGHNYGNPTFDEFYDLWINKGLKNNKDNYELLVDFIDAILCQNRNLSNYIMDLRGDVIVHHYFDNIKNCTLVIDEDGVYHFNIFDSIKIDEIDESVKSISVDIELDGDKVKSLDSVYDNSKRNVDSNTVYKHLNIKGINEEEATVITEDIQKNKYLSGLNSLDNKSKKLVKSKK